MSIKAAIDFGSCSTAAAVWNDATGQAETIRVPGLSVPGGFIIPSRITYETPERYFAGAMAAEGRGLFRWMKRYINLRSPYALKVGDERIDARRAAEDFLRAVLTSAFPTAESFPEELALSVPVESFEYYSEWLLDRFTGVRVRLIDEASAAAAGYGLSVHPGDALLVLDFGGSTLQAVCVSVTEEGEKLGRCCRVLGKSGVNIGGMTIDRWIYEDLLKRAGLSENDPRVRSVSGELLLACERLKMELSEAETAELDAPLDALRCRMTRAELTELMRRNGLFETLDKVLGEALKTAESRGFVKERLTAVLPVGGGCLIPAVRESLENRFGANLTASGEPLGAVARGAAAFAAGLRIYDFIQHDYAVRSLDPRTGQYAFRVIVPRGTAFPTENVGPKMTLKASYDGQTRFGIAIYETRDGADAAGTESEVFFDTDGSARVMPLTESERGAARRFWLNERRPLFLESEQPCARGVPQFCVTFGIDSNKMLTVTASRLSDGAVLLDQYPAVRLV